MNKLLTFLLLFACIKSHSQLIADPAVGQVSFTDISGTAIPDSLPLGYVAQLNIPIKNLSSVNELPAGSCKIKIGLGSKIILEPGFNLSIVNTSQYFEWTAELNSGQVQLTGDLKMPLPANFFDTAKFNVQGNILDYSTVTTNFLITNHNSQTILSDNDPANNSSFRPYKIIPPVPTPVNFSNVAVVKKDCAVEVSFTAENEINVSHFDIETSKDGIHFFKAGAVTAAQRIHYKFSFPITIVISSPVLYIRIKSVDMDGSFKYSFIKTLNGTCNSKGTLGIYPNPVKGIDYITVKSSGGSLNGKYQVILFDLTGRYISGKEISLTNQQQFTYPLGKITAGQYMLKLINLANGEPVIFELQKL